MKRTIAIVIDLRLMNFADKDIEEKLNDLSLELLGENFKFSAYGFLM
uniref:Uncharacterized protein n=1 Tax=Bracon brevicornis TaxID=1563983 RepID=A0A6V7KQZ2_9HYME